VANLRRRICSARLALERPMKDRFTRWSAAFGRGVIIASFAPTALVLLEESRAADTSVAAAYGIPASG
jgi:hypothetical protein